MTFCYLFVIRLLFVCYTFAIQSLSNRSGFSPQDLHTIPAINTKHALHTHKPNVDCKYVWMKMNFGCNEFLMAKYHAPLVYQQLNVRVSQNSCLISNSNEQIIRESL